MEMERHFECTITSLPFCISFSFFSRPHFFLLIIHSPSLFIAGETILVVFFLFISFLYTPPLFCFLSCSFSLVRRDFFFGPLRHHCIRAICHCWDLRDGRRCRKEMDGWMDGTHYLGNGTRTLFFSFWWE
jgi:hypothetical protein